MTKEQKPEPKTEDRPDFYRINVNQKISARELRQAYEDSKYSTRCEGHMCGSY